MNVFKNFLLILAVLFSCVYAEARNQFAIDSLNCQIFLPESNVATGRAVIICPGGSYKTHAINHEGVDWAKFFNDYGVAVAVIRYDLPYGDRSRPIKNINNVIAVLRNNAADWKINPDDIGIMGSSAGGHLASTIATHPERDNILSFQILFYPVISMQAPLTHGPSHDNFLGINPGLPIEEMFSNHKQVTSSTPRAIIFFSSDDDGVPVDNGIEYYNALRRNGVEASIHIYPEGGHGWGFRSDFPYHKEMLDELKRFINNY